MMSDILGKMKTLRKDFHACHSGATRFVEWANKKLEKTEEELVVETTIPVKRQIKKKCMPGEICTDEAVSAACPIKKYEIEVYNTVMDSIFNDIEIRYRSVIVIN